MSTERTTHYPIDPVFLDRWSPRAFDPSAMPTSDLLTILEAARWAPSAFNVQPWRFLYSQRGDANWKAFVSILDEFNQVWAQHASALVVILSDKLMPGEGRRPDKMSRYHSFDAGAAWAQLALQATTLGYKAHAMAGLNFDEAYARLHVPERYRVEIAVAIGRQSDPSLLPDELQVSEEPSQRYSLDKIAFAGGFPR